MNGEIVEYQESNSIAIPDTMLAVYVDAVKACAPWVKASSQSAAMTDQEVVYATRRALALGLDPLNPHEIQIWKDKRGTINFQIGYTLMAEWVRRFKGEHTEPQFDRLTAAELKAEGLADAAMAYRVRFLMKADIPNMRTLIDAGFSAAEARQMLEVTGLGVATPQEVSGEYFAPTGRSKAWKVQKRAVVDAYRRKFGTPTRAEIEMLRRALTPEDWERVDADLPADARVALAESAAHRREEAERVAADPEYAAQVQAHNTEIAGLLYGPVVEAEIVEAPPVAEHPAAPEPEPATAADRWVEDAAALRKFWAWSAQQGLGKDDVHEALGVASLKDYFGSKAQALAAIGAWVKAQTTSEAEA